MSKDKLVIIDSHALLHRAWHAIPNLSTKNGLMVNAVFGYTSLLLKIIKELNPSHLLATFDLKEKTFRHKEYKEYKAHRVKQVAEFYNQIPFTYEVLEAFNIPILTKKGYEADDIIGSIAQQAYQNNKDLEIIIVTGDLDALQLVNERVKVFTLKKSINDTITYDIAAIKERYGLEPRQLIDLKAIQGDASDNIKGVKGIGQKGAQDLIKKFNNLEEVYKNINKIEKERTKKLLLEYKEDAFLSKRLVTIVQDIELDWNLKKALLKDFNPEEVYKVFQKYEFNSLLNKIPHKDSNINYLQKDNDKYKYIDNKKNFLRFYKELKKQKIFSIDTETTGLNVLNNEILGISFSWQEKTGVYININNKEFKTFVLKELKSILEDDNIKKVGHNLKFDYKVFKVLNIKLKGIAFDTLLAAYLINFNRGLRLEELAFSYLGYKKSKLTDLLEEKPKNKKEINIREIPIDKLAYYAAEDADITWRLYKKLLIITEKENNIDLLQKIEIPLIPVLAEMELNGISLNIKFLKKLNKEFSNNLNKLTKKIHRLANSEFNISSPKQLKEVLFIDLKIDSSKIKKTKTGLSTAASELDKMKDSHPIINLIIEYRELSKLISTYIKALPELVNKKTKRVHTNFNQTVTATGRLSSSDPNLQNIPIRTALGRQIREAFIIPKGYTMLAADYSQIELRLAAAISQDNKMIKSFKKGEDIHARTAAEIHNIALKDVTKEIRRSAKEINFGILYGLGSLGLSRRTKMNRKEAQKFIEKYFTIYKGIKNYLEKTKEFAHKNKYVKTIFGRKRYLPDINSYMPMLKAASERMAINMPIQGTAADLMKIAMIKIYRDLPKISSQTKMLLQVHDEIILEVPNKDIKKVAKFIKKTMENVYKLSVPLIADIEIGNNWNNLKYI